MGQSNAKSEPRVNRPLYQLLSYSDDPGSLKQIQSYL
jgi:hypothetical protein